MSWEAVAAFAALGFTILTALVLTMRGLARIELSLRNYFEQKQIETLKALREDINASRTMFGETIRAAREHADLAHKRIEDLVIRHQELELYVRDNYVSMPAFEQTLQRVELGISKIDEKVDQLMQRPNAVTP